MLAWHFWWEAWPTSLAPWSVYVTISAIRHRPKLWYPSDNCPYCRPLCGGLGLYGLSLYSWKQTFSGRQFLCDKRHYISWLALYGFTEVRWRTFWKTWRNRAERSIKFVLTLDFVELMNLEYAIILRHPLKSPFEGGIGAYVSELRKTSQVNERYSLFSAFFQAFVFHEFNSRRY